MVSLRREEWDELTPAEKRAHLVQEEKNVFGHDVKHDRHGNPIEVGIGSKSQPSANHFRALATAEGPSVAEKEMAAAIKAGTFSPDAAAVARKQIADAVARGEIEEG
jgi:hypothetical protein